MLAGAQMPEISFSLDLGTVVSPVLLLVLAYLVNTARKAVDKRVDERHDETTTHLDRIEGKVDTTNGRVNKLEERQATHEAEAKADHDMLLTLRGNVDTLMGLRKETP